MRKEIGHLLCIVGFVSCGGLLSAQPIAVSLIAREGQTLPEGGIVALNAPFVSGSSVGFNGSVTTPSGSIDRFVWFETGIVWLSSAALPTVLTGAESTMGVSQSGDFIYSPSVDGDDGVWTTNGALLVETDPIPGTGLFSVFNSRPQMTASGSAHWIGGYSAVAGGGSEGRMLFESSSGGADPIVVLLQSGALIGGFEIAPSGVDFDYHFSSDGDHHIQVVDTVGTANTLFVLVDGALVLREGDPTGGGDNWDNFDAVAINTQGDYLVTGDTDGATDSDEFIAVNGSIAVREGDVIDGVALTGGTLRGVMINNAGQVAHLWGISGGDEILFLGDASALDTSSVEVLRTGDLVDFDADGVGDATVVDFNASLGVGPGVALSDAGIPYVEVDLLDPVTLAESESILAMGDASSGLQFIRGDCNADGTVDISDAITLLNLLFIAPGVLDCQNACDANDDEALDISDAIATLSALFSSPSVPLAPPYPACGVDLDGASLDCVDYSFCP